MTTSDEKLQLLVERLKKAVLKTELSRFPRPAIAPAPLPPRRRPRPSA
jgi:hypothetical protein